MLGGSHALNQQVAIQHVSHYYGTSNPKSNICQLNNYKANSMSHSVCLNQVRNQFGFEFYVLNNMFMKLFLLKAECSKDEIIVFQGAS